MSAACTTLTAIAINFSDEDFFKSARNQNEAFDVNTSGIVFGWSKDETQDFC
jgi:hypothetical protein